MVTISIGYYEAPYGRCFIAFSERGLMALIFEEDEIKAKTDFQKRFKGAGFEMNIEMAETWGKRVFEEHMQIPLDLQGTDFQKKVWNALLLIPSGKTVSYKDVALMINHPDAVRATGTAIGANPVAWYIPCHRVIRSDGKPGGYRWGLQLKKQMLIAEGIKCNW